MNNADPGVPVKPVDPNWPKWKYHSSGKSKMVFSKKEEDFLGSAWKDSPLDHGTIVYPHSDEYMAKLEMDKAVEAMPEPMQEEPEMKPKRGRKPKGE